MKTTLSGDGETHDVEADLPKGVSRPAVICGELDVQGGSFSPCARVVVCRSLQGYLAQSRLVMHGVEMGAAFERKSSMCAQIQEDTSQSSFPVVLRPIRSPICKAVV
jgi:hypothetical protein